MQVHKGNGCLGFRHDSICKQTTSAQAQYWLTRGCKELLARKQPYSDVSHILGIIKAITSGVKPSKPSVRDQSRPNSENLKILWGLCCVCWRDAPEQRWSISRAAKFLFEIPSNRRRAEYYQSIASTHAKSSEWNEAIIASRGALDIWQKLFLEVPDYFRATLADSYRWLGFCYGKLKKWGEAANAMQTATELRETLFEDDLSTASDLAWTYHNLGFFYEKSEKWAKAVTATKRAVELREELCGSLQGIRLT